MTCDSQHICILKGRTWHCGLQDEIKAKFTSTETLPLSMPKLASSPGSVVKVSTYNEMKKLVPFSEFSYSIMRWDDGVIRYRNKEPVTLLLYWDLLSTPRIFSGGPGSRPEQLWGQWEEGKWQRCLHIASWVLSRHKRQAHVFQWQSWRWDFYLSRTMQASVAYNALPSMWPKSWLLSETSLNKNIKCQSSGLEMWYKLKYIPWVCFQYAFQSLLISTSRQAP